MGSIGSWWVRGFDKYPGESVEASYYANYLRPSGRPLGGKVYLTSERLLFCPHLIDAIFGGNGREIELSDVLSVDQIDSVDAQEHGGGTKERLRIVLTNEEEVIFVLNDLDTAAMTIDQAVADRIEGGGS